MNNPWNKSRPFDAMFVDPVVLGLASGHLSCDACVFPVEDVDPFTESTTTNAAKSINALVRYADVHALSSTTRPKIGDSLEYGGASWAMADVQLEQNWYRITARSKA